MRDVESFLEANDGSMTIYGFIDREGQVQWRAGMTYGGRFTSRSKTVKSEGHTSLEDALEGVLRAADGNSIQSPIKTSKPRTGAKRKKIKR